MSLELVPEPIAFPRSSLADIPTKLRQLADKYEANPDVRANLVIVVRESDNPVEVYGLGAGTDSGLALAMVIRARSVLVQLLLEGKS